MKVHIDVPAIREIEIDESRKTRVTEKRQVEVTITKDVTGNPNFDHYLQPQGDLLYDFFGHSGEFSYGGVNYLRSGENDVTIRFDAEVSELREAAQQRASEDWCHEVHVLAEWACRAERRHESIAWHINEALDEASDESPDAQYRKEMGGGADMMEDTTDGSLGGKAR